MRTGYGGSVQLSSGWRRAASVALPGCLLLLAHASLWGDSWQITPTNSQAPDTKLLEVAEFQATIRIDGGHAVVSVREVFRSHANNVQEGTFSAALPGDAAVSDFAVWDEVVRIPGVILERKRAEELYEQIRNMAIDPGLLESGEITESNATGEAKRSAEFTAKIVPIPAQGYKRIELQYRQTVPADQLESAFVFPLKPAANQVLQVEKLSLSVEIDSPQEISGFEAVANALPLKVVKQDAHMVVATYDAANARISSDLAFRWKVASDPKPQVNAYRDPPSGDPGFFEASAITPNPAKTAPANGQLTVARTVLVLFDTSLSMQWDKLERSFQALEATLRALTPADRFNVLVFNSEAAPVTPDPVPATTENIATALDRVRASTLRGGTNLEKALEWALIQSRAGNTSTVLLSDGDMTEGTVVPSKLGTWFDGAWKAKPAEQRPHLYVLAIGDDANVRLMQRLASHGGAFEQVHSTETLEFKLQSFVGKIGLAPYDSLTLNATPARNFDLVYRLEKSSYPESKASWVGEYKAPGNATFAVNASYGGRALPAQTQKVKLPSSDTQHAYLPATWARARVDALLEKIDRDGEDTATIAEIIRLSRKYKFVTPYTSFLAAPRSLLRPRLIRPGDPVLRVRTDPSVVSVIALFPFGLTKPLRYLKQEDIWQTRFLAPADLADGVYTVRLILRDREGRVARENKTFLISSQPPLVRATLDRNRARPGDTITLNVRASQTTRLITARLYGAEPVSLRWSEGAKSNTGTLIVPASLPAGRYSIHVTAEDVAHNVSHQEVPLDVLP